MLFLCYFILFLSPSCLYFLSSTTSTNFSFSFINSVLFSFLQLYVSRIGFTSLSSCAASKTKISLSESFQIISEDITTTYSSEMIKEKICSSYKIAIRLEIDEHVVSGMERIQSACVARTHYIQYLLAIHMKDLISLECERFLSSLSKNVLSSSDTIATSRDQKDKKCPTSSSLLLSQISKEGDPPMDFSDPSNDAAAGQVEVVTSMSLPSSYGDDKDDDGILLHLICCKKIALEYYHDSKKLFIETNMCNEFINSHTNMSNAVIKNPLQTRIEIEMIDGKNLAVQPDLISSSISNKSYNELSEEENSLASNRKRNISDI